MQLGRKKIFTDQKVINEFNLIHVLQRAYGEHLLNASDSLFLMNYEKGVQPLQREKKIRKDIDIVVCDNVAAEIVDFKLGYDFGNPIMYIQRADKDIAKSDAKKNDEAISMLNQMLEDEGSSELDQRLGRDLIITGLGYQYVDIKKDYDEGGSLFDLVTLDPLHTFMVYDHSVKQNKVLGVTFYVAEDGDKYFDCFTDEWRYLVKNCTEIVKDSPSGEQSVWKYIPDATEKNPLGKIPIVEFERSADRMGVFERQIADMDALNILVSDMSNQISQETQSIWWGNDIDFPKASDGTTVKPQSGQWVLTFTGGEGKQPKIQPLSISSQYAGVLDNIKYRRDIIKQKCSVPLQSEAGYGNTGTATSMSTGWQNAEVSASKSAHFTERGKAEVLDLILRAIKKAPETPSDSPLLDLRKSDVRASITRDRTYDLTSKINVYATGVKHGIHPRHMLEVIEMFPDTNLVYTDSEPYLDMFYDNLYKPEEQTDENTNNADLDKMMSDKSDNISQSPILDGMNRTNQPTGGENLE